MRLSQDFKLESLLFVAFFATLPLYSPNLVLFHDAFVGSEAFMPPFVNTLMVASVAVGLVVAVVASRGKATLFARLPVVVGSAACYLVGFVLFAVCLGVAEAGSAALAVVAGVLVAGGCVPLCIAWGTYLAELDLRQALFSLALLVGMASLVELLLSSVSAQVGLVVYGLLLVLGVILPCWKASTGMLAERAQPAVVERGAFVASVRRMASVLAMPFIGLLVFGFVMGVRKFVVFDLFYIEALGGIAAAVLVLPLCFVRMQRPLLSFLYQVLLPAFALALVLLNAFPVGTWLQWFAASMSYVFFGVVGILALASLCAMAHAREFPPALIYGLTVASFMVVSFAGILCGAVPVFADNAGPILLVVCTAYFVFLVFAPLVSAWRREGVEQQAALAGTSAGAGDVQERCDRAAHEHGLSPRETEVLSYLGRGHGIAFVAKTLVVSESTVRTHVKSIYKKLNVSSREELLQLIDEE